MGSLYVVVGRAIRVLLKLVEILGAADGAGKWSNRLIGDDSYFKAVESIKVRMKWEDAQSWLWGSR
jgi:hypothetical protein